MHGSRLVETVGLVAILLAWLYGLELCVPLWCPSVTDMGVARKARANRENTFLESVKADLVSLREDLVHIKLLIHKIAGPACYFNDCDPYLKPPPAPPPIDVYDRNFLLSSRPAKEEPISMQLPEMTDYTMTEERETFSALSGGAKEFMPSAVIVDYDSLCFTLDEEDLEQYMEHVKSAETNAHKDEDLIIAEAQHKARTSRFRENWAINRIQLFWRACKTKVNAIAKSDMLWQTKRTADRMDTNYWSPDDDYKTLLQEQLKQGDHVVDEFLDYYFEALDCRSMNDLWLDFSTPSRDGRNDSRRVWEEVSGFMPGSECISCHTNYERCSCNAFATSQELPSQSILERAPPDREVVLNIDEERANFICNTCATLYDDMYLFCRLCGSRQIREWLEKAAFKEYQRRIFPHLNYPDRDYVSDYDYDSDLSFNVSDYVSYC